MVVVRLDHLAAFSSSETLTGALTCPFLMKITIADNEPLERLLKAWSVSKQPTCRFKMLMA
jgi:hypothetical protein